MKVFIQPTQDSPKDFIQSDSKDWGAFIRIRPFAISVQGVTFSADWYCIVDQPYGCNVVTLNDDIRWYPEPIANVWQFRHIAPDLNGAWNTNQSRIIYTDKLITIPANTILRPFSEFRTPANFLEGLLVSDELSAAHTAMQNIEGWRKWTEGLPEEEIVDGVIRDQTPLGRYLKAEGTRTYIQRDTSSTNAIHDATHENAFTVDTAAAGTQTGASLGFDQAISDWLFTTAALEPNATVWPTGIYRFQFDVSAAGSNIRFGCVVQDFTAGHFARINQILTGEISFKQQVEAVQSGTGLKLVTTGNWTPAAGNNTDRFECLITTRNIAAHGGSQSLTLNLNTADSFADGPWPAAGGDVGGILLPRLQTNKYRHIIGR